MISLSVNAAGIGGPMAIASTERARDSKAAGVDARAHSPRSQRTWVGTSQPAGGR